MSTRSISLGKGGLCVRLTILPPSYAVVAKSGNLNFLETSGPLQTCNGTAYLFLLLLYMFRTVFPSIIRNFRLYIQQQACVKQILLMFASKQTAVSVWHMPVAVCTVWNSWWWTERSPETCRVLLQNKQFDTLVLLVGFTIEILYFNSIFTCYNFDSVIKEGYIVNPTGGT